MKACTYLYNLKTWLGTVLAPVCIQQTQPFLFPSWKALILMKLFVADSLPYFLNPKISFKNDSEAKDMSLLAPWYPCLMDNEKHRKYTGMYLKINWVVCSEGQRSPLASQSHQTLAASPKESPPALRLPVCGWAHPGVQVGCCPLCVVGWIFSRETSVS